MGFTLPEPSECSATGFSILAAVLNMNVERIYFQSQVAGMYCCLGAGNLEVYSPRVPLWDTVRFWGFAVVV